MAKKAASSPKSSKNVDKVVEKDAATAADSATIVLSWANANLKKDQVAHVGDVGKGNFRVNLLEPVVHGLFHTTRIAGSYYVTVQDGKVVDLTLKGKT